MLHTTQRLKPCYYQLLVWFSVINLLWLGGTSQAAVIFQDNFDYVVDRNVTNGQIPFESRGWTDVKANNTDYNRGSGYLYTRYDTTLNSRVLVMESLPTQSSCNPWCQTDYWLKYGSDNSQLGTVPANVWFQFWTYTVPGSLWDSQKFFYPCHTSYPCPATEYLWLIGFQPHTLAGNDGDTSINAPPGGRYFLLRSAYANNTRQNSWNRDKLYQNLNTAYYLAVGVWYQVRIHIDTSGSQGVYELWVRERGVTTWTKLAEWIGGVTPGFDWPIPTNMRSGNRVFAMPTTVSTYNSTTYMDNFIMATSLTDLEASDNSSSSGDTTPPSPPQQPRIVP
jgi:hypothetical protein